ncbi:MAG: zinc-dependent metalloprotease [Bacteroidota bacterium]
MSLRLPLVLLVTAVWASAPAAQDLWTDVEARSLSTSRAMPTAYRALALDRPAMEARLAEAPDEIVPGTLTGAVEIPLPLPDGTTPMFRIVESSILTPGLQARYPQLRTYVGSRADDPRTTVRLSATPLGLSAWIQGPDGLAIIDPVGGESFHMAYQRRDAVAPAGWAAARRQERVLSDPEADSHEAHGRGAHVHGAHSHGAHDHGPSIATSRRADNGAILRTYELAVATTGEYAQFHGGTVESTMEAIVVAMARVNGLYERDFSIRMVLIPEMEKIIFTDPVMDPFSDGNPGALISQVQTVIDDSIGTNGYDIGHVFSTGGGGLAGFGVVCRRSRKAQGVTGLPAPIGDPFYVDYVAHEIGHQFRGSHTFNGSAGACGGANRSPSRAYEPGSGSTIMAYAGICGAHNLQNNSDPFFHNASLREVWDYIGANAGNVCPDEAATGNTPPVISVSDTLHLPVETAFELVGSATDETPDALTYIWEQLDVGLTAGAPPGRSGFNGRPPLFRSFVPTAEPRRTFPDFGRYRLGLAPAIGEAFPTQTETLNFRMTVRDNAPGAGAVADERLVAEVDGDVGPFAITFPNARNLEFEVGTDLEITWDVAGTGLTDGEGNEDADEVDVETVDLLISLDDGLTFQPLATATLNDGTETVTLPADEATDARLLVRATVDDFGSSFFDLNDESFALVAPTAGEERPEAGGVVMAGPWPNPARGTARAQIGVPTTQAVDVSLYDALGRRVRTVFAGALAAADLQVVEIETAGLAPGVYVLRLVGETGAVTRALTLAR